MNATAKKLYLRWISQVPIEPYNKPWCRTCLKSNKQDFALYEGKTSCCAQQLNSAEPFRSIKARCYTFPVSFLHCTLWITQRCAGFWWRLPWPNEYWQRINERADSGQCGGVVCFVIQITKQTTKESTIFQMLLTVRSTKMLWFYSGLLRFLIQYLILVREEAEERNDGVSPCGSETSGLIKFSLSDTFF